MSRTTRGIKLGINSAILTAGVIAITVMLYILTTQKPIQHDFTKEKLNTLSKETVGVLKKIDKNKKFVLATVFLNKGSFEETKVKDLLDEMKRHCKYFNYQMVDPYRQPEIYQRMNMDDFGVVFEAGQPNSTQYRKKIVYRDDLFTYDNFSQEATSFQNGEQVMAGALISVALKKDVTLCFTRGNGEITDEDRSGKGISEIADKLESDAYMISYTDLARDKTVPPECQVLITASQIEGFSTSEREKIQAFLDKGGGMLLMIDLLFPDSLNKLLKEWGLGVDQTFVVDPKSTYSVDGFNVKPIFAEHEVTQGLNMDRSAINMLGPQALEISKKPPKNVMANLLLETTAEAVKVPYAIMADGVLAPQQENIEQGKQVLGAAVEIANKGKKDGRIVVLSDSEFVTNAYIELAGTVTKSREFIPREDAGPGNADFFLNCVNWLAGEEDLISLRPKVAENRPLNIDPQMQKFYFNLFTFVVPLGILVIGALIWHRRRSL